jgi:hypothetical protein
MKFLTNKITQAKELYKRNKVLGILLLFGIFGLPQLFFALVLKFTFDIFYN